MKTFGARKWVWLAILSGLVSLRAFGITITSPVSATDLVTTILGPGFPSVFNVTFTGANTAAGTFTGGSASGIGIDQGIILSTGNAGSAPGPNRSTKTSKHHDLEGDEDLNKLLGYDTWDAAVLEFEFTLTSQADLLFEYVFASEEYSEYVSWAYNDVFGFFLWNVNTPDQKLNLAIVPGTSDPVSVNTVNSTTNDDYFVNNDYTDQPPGSPYNLEYDGFTSVFTAQALGLGPGTYRMKLAIADAGDHLVDSAVFIEARSFRIVLPRPVPDAGSTATLMGLGLAGLVLVRRRWRTVA